VRRSALLLVTAFAVGLLAAFAASCAGNGVKGGLPQSSADDLKAQISDVQEFVDRGDCDGIDGQLRQVQQAIDNLPESTDEALVANLRQGAEQLQAAAITACNSRTSTTPQTQTQTQTVPQQTVTEAIPTVTETVPTAPPDTTPTAPTETTPTVPPATTPPAATVPGDTSGGAGVTP
jgi:hypothetical protein